MVKFFPLSSIPRKLKPRYYWAEDIVTLLNYHPGVFKGKSKTEAP
jgi:hypothetical protein